MSGQLPDVVGRGDVVWVEDPFALTDTADEEGPDHPYVVISTDEHPFHGLEYLAMLITSTGRSAGVRIPDSAWTFGDLTRESWISPWVVVTIKHAGLDGYQGSLGES